MSYGLWCQKTNKFTLREFTNADWVGIIDDRKIASGATFFLQNCLVSWLSKKQTSISLSTVEAGYISVASCCIEVIWMKQTLEDLLVKYEDPIVISCDNTSAINILRNLVVHSNKKHIPIKYHFLRDQVSQKVVKLEYVNTKEYIADIFMKPLPKEAFEHIRQKMGVISLQ